MGMLWDLIDGYRDRQEWPPSYRQIAGKIGVSPTALMNWRTISRLPESEHLRALSDLIGVPYSRVLDAALGDAGYYEQTGGEGRGQRSPSMNTGQDAPTAVIKAAAPKVVRAADRAPGPAAPDQPPQPRSNGRRQG